MSKDVSRLKAAVMSMLGIGIVATHASPLWAQMEVGEYGGAPGLVVDGRPTPPIFAPVTPSPGSAIIDGRLRLHSGRKGSSLLQTQDPLPDVFTLTADIAVLKALEPGAGLTFRLSQQEGGQQGYVLAFTHHTAGNRVSLVKQRKGRKPQPLMDVPFAWELGVPMKLTLQVRGADLAVTLDEQTVGAARDAEPLPGGPLRLTADSATATVDNLRVHDARGEVVFADDFDTDASGDRWTNFKRRLRPMESLAPTFAELDFHLYHDTYNAGGGVGMSLDRGGVWSGPGQFNWSPVDRALRSFANRDPEARVLARVELNAPKWWLAAHPDDRMLRMKPEGGSEAGAYASYASEAWKRDAADGLRRYLRFVGEHANGKAVAGVILGAGGSYEWVYSWHPGYHDYSPVHVKAFREWLRERYDGSPQRLRDAWKDQSVTFDTAEVPSPAMRMTGHLGGFFDPAQSRQVPDYKRFHSEVVADAILHFARVTKETSPGMFVAVYYGYLLGSSDDYGHAALDRVLQSRDVDAVMCPNPYVGRYPGGVNTAAIPLDTVRMYGKLWLQDDDTRTHLSGSPFDATTRYFGRGNSAWESVQLLRRNFAYSLSKSMGLVHLDFALGWLDDPAIVRAIAEHRRLAMDTHGKDRRPNSEIVLVTNPATSYYSVAQERETLYTNQVHEYMPRIGAPYDVISIEHLAEAPDYKLYVFLDAFYLTDEQRAVIDATVKRDGKTSLWFYAPGFVTEEGLSDEAMASLTGIDLAHLASKSRARLVLTDLKHPITQGVQPGLMMEMINVAGPVIYCRDPEARVLGMQNARVNHFEPAYRKRPETVSAFAVKEMDGWRSVWSAVPNLTPEILRNIARQAGVHIYSDSDDALYANRFMVSIHARYAGEREIRLPQSVRVVNATTGEIVTERADTFRVHLEQFETGLWWLEP